MLTSLRSCVVSLVRERSLMLWALLFPIAMTCIFMGMFSGVEEAYDAVSSRLGVVDDVRYQTAIGLDQTLEALSEGDGDEAALLALVRYDSEADARKAAEAGDVDAYLTVDARRMPELHVTQSSLSERGSLPVAVLQEVLDVYVRTRAAVFGVAAERPDLVLSGDAVEALTADAVTTVRLEATKSQPSPTARYYFSMLAMTCGLGAMLALVATKQLMPTASPLGARRTLAAVPRWRMLAGTLLGSWLCEFACMALALAFMWVVAGVDFGTTPALAALAVAVCTLAGCAAGTLLGTFPHMQPGLVSGITCLLSLFTGLYGTACQELADAIEAAAPALAHANPLWQMANCFYALLYYDTLGPFAQSCAVLVAMAVAFLAVATLRMRRTSYDHL